jgi:ATPase subunit of ABC transporter with duplicated ATPase domains
VNALLLIDSQVQSLSNFAAVVARLSSLIKALERKLPAAEAGIEMSEEDRRVAYEELTLLSPLDRQPVLTDLSISIPSGSRTLFSGGNEIGKQALFRETGRPRLECRLWKRSRRFAGHFSFICPDRLREPTIWSAICCMDRIFIAK